MNDNDTKVLEPVGKSVYVYQLPIRIWHWTMVACVSVLIVTGYIIGKPWHSVTGQPYDTFYMGYTRMAHFIAGFTLVISTVLRYLYALIGNKYSRELLILPVWRKSWWGGLWSDVRWYLFLDKEPRAYVGHNPLAQAGMAVGMVFMLVIMLSGLGMYAESSQSALFRPFLFMLDLMYGVGGNGQELRSLHRLGMLLLVTFVTVHVYMVIREEIMGKTTLVSAMFSGFRERRRR
ncbi:MAG: Ni/Fe-hydrogenase, b-type cytochrome subunit [Desulfovibrio sp.]|uniref:Ni/Fe-hydrogenase, b-type cytochrome subunit n=1 Tax=Desulfovibrio sp. TaxID=885 RepID=UPI002587D37E|nr:Ni/Fe-hydrogenase, b-type cytochrome subunit [Desulfovibrio sp.]MCD7984559.1 Ni/Fe-hydrogenase, b-type cytochrome subunit [Desulfovibrio sp.]